MSATALHRQAIVDTAVRLFRKQGYAATGLNQIVDESGAPKGSLYHYFPGGKLTIAEAAVRRASAKVTDTLRLLDDECDDPATLYRRYLARLAGWMHKSGFRDGCPIMTTLLETAPQEPALRDAGAEALADWAAVLSGALQRKGVARSKADRLGRVAIAALEGALVQARVRQQKTPLQEVAREIGDLFDSAIVKSPFRQDETRKAWRPSRVGTSR